MSSGSPLPLALENRTLQVSILIVNYNGGQAILDCLGSLQLYASSVPHEIIVVDNASTDSSPLQIASQFPTVSLVRSPQNRGFGAANNMGAAIAQGEYLLLLNPDTQLTQDILPTLIEILNSDRQLAIVGPQLRHPDGSLQISTSPAISLRGEFQALKRLKTATSEQIDQQFSQSHFVDIVVGAALCIRRQTFEKLQGFDEAYFMYFEESDLCQRAQNEGWKILYTPAISLIHIKGFSTRQTADPMRLEYRRSQLYFYKKHRPLWEQAVLRLYLFTKFGLEWLRSPNPISLKILGLLFQF